MRDCVLSIGVRVQRIWILRKALEARNIAEQVLETGTGALWLDGCRIITTENLNGGTYSPGGGQLPLKTVASGKNLL